MRNPIIALLIAIFLVSCSSVPRTGPSLSDGAPPTVAPSSTGGAESALPTTPSTVDVPEPAETPPDHGKEIVKAMKVAGGVVLVVVAAAFWLVVSVAAAFAH